MIQQEKMHRREIQFDIGDQVLLSTRYIRFGNSPRKLQRRFVGSFEIIHKISSVAYELQLPEKWKMHPVFHISLLKPWRTSTWSSPVNLQPENVEPATEPVYKVEKLLRWRWVTKGRKRYREFLVTWTSYPLEEAMWIPEKNFTYPKLIKQMMKQDKPLEDTSGSSLE